MTRKKQLPKGITIPFPDKKYKIIYADPPWKYWAGGKKNAARHYDVMNIEDIKKIPVNQIADDDSVICMWVTFPIIPEALDLINAWGFSYSTVIFTWIKKNKETNSLFWGCGNYTRANAEVIMLGKKGKGIQRQSKSVHQIIESPFTKHSKKPDLVRGKIIQLFGDLPRIELFARTKIHGWDTWGNDPKLELEPLESYYD
jgi:site-specific DNA-methyltransferase (adenine-specific)